MAKRLHSGDQFRGLESNQHQRVQSPMSYQLDDGGISKHLDTAALPKVRGAKEKGPRKRGRESKPAKEERSGTEAAYRGRSAWGGKIPRHRRRPQDLPQSRELFFTEPAVEATADKPARVAVHEDRRSVNNARSDCAKQFAGALAQFH
jgi:hypothetical protein